MEEPSDSLKEAPLITEDTHINEMFNEIPADDIADSHQSSKTSQDWDDIEPIRQVSIFCITNSMTWLT
jgi:hypothetical protein